MADGGGGVGEWSIVVWGSGRWWWWGGSGRWDHGGGVGEWQMVVVVWGVAGGGGGGVGGVVFSTHVQMLIIISMHVVCLN